MSRNIRRTVRLRQNLTARRRELLGEVNSRVRDRRSTRALEGRDDLEHSEADSQEDIEFALLQMRAETLTLIDAALVRLDAGRYGSCVECQEEISEPRLQAVPFAVRCQACEQAREQGRRDARQIAPPRGTYATFPGPAGF